MSIDATTAVPTMTSTIFLTRHAHTEMAGRFCGQIDPPLSEQGRGQLLELADRLTKFRLTHIFSSNLLRAQETANCIAAKSGLTVKLLPALRELSFGEWEGLTWDEVTQKNAEYAERWMAKYPLLPAPGGEVFDRFRARVQSAMAEVASRVSGGNAVVVTHAGVIRTFMLDVLNLPESSLASLTCEYASSVEVRRQSGQWYLQE